MWPLEMSSFASPRRAHALSTPGKRLGRYERSLTCGCPQGNGAPLACGQAARQLEACEGRKRKRGPIQTLTPRVEEVTGHFCLMAFIYSSGRQSEPLVVAADHSVRRKRPLFPPRGHFSRRNGKSAAPKPGGESFPSRIPPVVPVWQRAAKLSHLFGLFRETDVVNWRRLEEG